MKTIVKISMFALCAMMVGSLMACNKDGYEPMVLSSGMTAEAVMEGICTYGTNEATYYCSSWKVTEGAEVTTKKYSTLGQSGLEVGATRDGDLAICFGGGVFVEYADTDKGSVEAYIRICHEQSGIIEDFALPRGESFRDAVVYSVKEGDKVWVQVFMKMDAGCDGESGDVALRATTCAEIRSFYRE